MAITLRTNLLNKLREFERCHANWMQSTIFQPTEQAAAKKALDTARNEYLEARNAWDEFDREQRTKNVIQSLDWRLSRVHAAVIRQTIA